MKVFVSLGSNKGDRIAYLREAVRALAEKATLLQISSVYETAPMYMEDQSEFLNAVAVFETAHTAREFFSLCGDTEFHMGRERTLRNGPRIIDIDILLCDSEIVDSQDLVIPHPRMQERGFVLVPLAEIARDVIHPVLGKTSSQLLAQLGDTSAQVRRYAEAI